MEENKLQEIAEMYMTYGVRSISMDDISRQLRISKKTLYQHFKDKNELVKVITKMVIDEQQKEYDEISNTTSNPIEEFFKLTKCLRKHFSEMNPSLVFDLQKYHKDAYEVLVDYEHGTVFEMLKKNLEKGVVDGYYRKDINVRILAKMRVEQVHMSFDPHVFPKNEYDFTEVQMQMIEHFIYGLLTAKGHKLYEKYKQEN